MAFKEKNVSEEKRSCYNCKYQATCFLRCGVYNVIMPKAVFLLEGAPKPWMSIFDALAMICSHYMRKEEDVEA